jgi:eukaryotic-like serine/threonine-protein kinase
MSVTADQLWNLTVVSGLIAADHRPAWEDQFRSEVEADQPNDVKALAKWLVKQNIISRYQAGVLLSEKAGPFQYGDFQIYDRIAEGGWKGCYRAVHTATRHSVTLKFVSSKQLQIDSWAKIQGVVASRRSWEHTTYLRCHAANKQEKYRILVFDDFPAGESLADRLQRETLDAKEATRIIRILALGLVPAHGVGQCHGDIRPENIWLAKNGGAMLICDPTHVATPLTPEIALEQANYRAPEFPLPGPASTPLSDTYALGCLMYHCVTGQPPFPDGDVAFKQQCHATQPVAQLPETAVPSGLFQLMTYMMAKNAGVRYQQISDVAEQAVPFLESSALKIPSRPAVESEASFLAAMVTASAAMKLNGGIGGAPAFPPTANPPILPPAAQPSAPQPSAPQPSAPQPSSPQPSASAFGGMSQERGFGGAVAQAQIAAPIASPTASPAAPVAKPGVAAAPTNQAARIRQQKRRQLHMLLLTILTIAAIGGGGYWGVNHWRNVDNDSDVAKGEPKDAEQDSGKPDVDVVRDDGKFLWESPTSGKQLDLSMLPFESMGVIALRPKSLLATEEGPRLLRALGPAFEKWQRRLERQIGYSLEDLDQLIISLHPRGDDWPEAAYVVTLAAEIDRDDLLGKLGDPEEKVTEEDPYYLGAEFACYLPEGDKVSRFAIGSNERMKEVGELAGDPPPPRTGTEPVIRASDQDRHVSILFVPYFVSTNLLRDGREYYFGEAKKVREPLDWLLGSGIKAGLFSAHFDRNTYIELQIHNDVTKNPYGVANDLRNRVSEMPALIETYIAQELNPPVYWRKLAFRYPDMITALHDETRIQVDGKLAVVNAILPGVAAHNLAAGGELLLASQPTEMMVVGETKPKVPQNMDELLLTDSKLAFAQQSFENVIRTIENDVLEKYPDLPFYFDVKVIGPDLEANGITRNKEVSNFDAEGTVADVLTALCRKVNPVTTVKEASEPDQKLVWVVGPDPDDESKTAILITSRDASTAKNYTLPEVFRLKEPE